MERSIVKQGIPLSWECILCAHYFNKREDLAPEFPWYPVILLHLPTQAVIPAGSGSPQLWAGEGTAVHEQLMCAPWPAKICWLVKQNYHVELSSFPSVGTVVFLCQAATFPSSWALCVWSLYCLSNRSLPVDPKTLVLREGARLSSK